MPPKGGAKRSNVIDLSAKGQETAAPKAPATGQETAAPKAPAPKPFSPTFVEREHCKKCIELSEIVGEFKIANKEFKLTHDNLAQSKKELQQKLDEQQELAQKYKLEHQLQLQQNTQLKKEEEDNRNKMKVYSQENIDLRLKVQAHEIKHVQQQDAIDASAATLVNQRQLHRDELAESSHKHQQQQFSHNQHTQQLHHVYRQQQQHIQEQCRQLLQQQELRHAQHIQELTEKLHPPLHVQQQSQPAEVSGRNNFSRNQEQTPLESNSDYLNSLSKRQKRASEWKHQQKGPKKPKA